MSKIKDYMLDLEDKIVDAIELGATTDGEIYLYVRNSIDASFQDVVAITRSFYADYDLEGEANA